MVKLVRRTAKKALALRAKDSYRLQALPPTAVAEISKIQEPSHSKDDADADQHDHPAPKHAGISADDGTRSLAPLGQVWFDKG